MSKRHFLGALALAIVALTSSSAGAAALQHPGWLPWHGCWRADGAPATELLCIVPDGAGVRMVTLDNGAILGESRVITDGRARPVRQEGCDGTEQAQWSADGQRVFLTSDLNCEGGLARRVSGIFSITGLTEWVSAQSVTIDGKTATRSVRYTSVQTSNLPGELLTALNTSPGVRVAARERALAAISEQDIDEAINLVEPAAVQEWLNATGQPYQLSNDAQEQIAASASALELVGGVARAEPYVQREVVHVVERPTYVHHTTYVHSVRSCWDPFVSGWVSFGYGLGVGVTYSDCGRRYYSHYSPWGYDLYGWRYFHSPLVFIRGGPRIVRPIIVRVNRDRDYYRNYHDRNYRDYRDYRPRGIPVSPRDRDDDDRVNQGGRATRNGYTRGTAAPRPAGEPQRVAPTTRSEPSTRSASSQRVAPTTRWAQPVRVSPTRRSEPTTRFEPSVRQQSTDIDRSPRSAQSRDNSARASSGYRVSPSARSTPSVRPAPSTRSSSSTRSAVPRLEPSVRSSSSPRAAPSVRSSSSSSRVAPSARSSGSRSGYTPRASSGSSSSSRSAAPARSARPRN